VWRCGDAGAKIPLLLSRDGTPLTVDVPSADRFESLKKPRLQ
jgi:hypothetical protein